MARLSRRLWGGTSLKTAAKEANCFVALCSFVFNPLTPSGHLKIIFLHCLMPDDLIRQWGAPLALQG